MYIIRKAGAKSAFISAREYKKYQFELEDILDYKTIEEIHGFRLDTEAIYEVSVEEGYGNIKVLFRTANKKKAEKFFKELHEPNKLIEVIERYFKPEDKDDDWLMFVGDEEDKAISGEV